MEVQEDWKSFKSLNCIDLSSSHFFTMHYFNNVWKKLYYTKYVFVTSLKKTVKNDHLFCEIILFFPNGKKKKE